MTKKRAWERGPPGNQRSREANIHGAFASRAGGYQYRTGNMNAHLTERFRNVRVNDDDRYPDSDTSPLARPNRTNGDIWEYFQDAQKPVTNAGSWIHKPEVPTSAEILPNCQVGFVTGEQMIDFEEELRPNRVEGAYESNEEYLSTQYELLREDAIRPLRQAVEEVRKDPWRDECDYPQSSGIGIYEPVYLKAIQFSFRGLSAKVAFSLSRVKKLIRWRQSKRLITGTLVALSPADDAFYDPAKILLATVGARPLSGVETNNPPEIDLFFMYPDRYDWDPSRKYIMVESRSSFFEASRHTLLALQHMMREPFPLSEHIVKAKSEVGPPDYIRISPHSNLSSLVSIDEVDQFQDVNILKHWPTGNSLILDSSQSKALNRMMTKKLAIVQGPPGTGKTYVSVVALKAMLQNMRMDDPPIIVTCQTNHALDQLLRHVAEFEPGFLRLGGQTKDQDKIKKRTLYEVRNDYQQPKMPGSRKGRAMGAMKQLTSKMQMLLAPFERGKTPLDQRFLARLGLISKDQAESLQIGTPTAMGIPQNIPGIEMEQWLGRSLECYERPYQPDDFGMPYEEDDFDEAEQLEELEAEAVARDDDDDIEALRGPISTLSDNWKGKTGGKLTSDAEIQAKLDKTEDLTTIDVEDRGTIYNYFLRNAKRIVFRQFGALAKQYAEQVNLKKIGQWEEDQGILVGQRVIGMTTTGLSKYRALIASLRPRVVLIEEAGETLEAPVTAACFPTLEHLILVGDHQQLRPHCNLRDFEDEPYNFNLSLFERMVSNQVELDTLTRQRRMIPEIRRLLEPIYGDKLEDHVSVKRIDNRPPVEGMGGTNSFFFTHEWPESRDNNQSTKNEKEAEMVVGFFDYLVLNGIDPKRITVLTFYNGQRKLLTGKLRQHQNLRGQAIKVVTVDSYQGEENDIILLSLVRSSKEGKIGFLSVDNRVCVALSRARRGFYLFGNAENLVVGSDTWEAVAKIMWGHGKKNEFPKTGPKMRIGYHLPLTCVNHEKKSFIQVPSDWELTSGGCMEKCKCVLACGHSCMLNCHPFDSDRINCMQRCIQPCATCQRPCNEICSDPCKCINCDRRSDGKKAIIKPSRKTSRSVQQPPPNFPFPVQPITQLVADQIPASSLVETTSQRSGSTSRQWEYFANGGARAEDARLLAEQRERQREETAKFRELISDKSSSSAALPPGKLIQISPKKRSTKPSENTQLLIDLAEDNEPISSCSASGAPHKGMFSYIGDIASPVGPRKYPEKPEEKTDTWKAPKQEFNLLD